MIPIFKKKDRDNVENYRPVRILPNFSKIYDRCLYDQMYKYFNHILSEWQCELRERFSTQHCLLVMTEKWRKYLYKEGINEAIHDLLITKLAVYGFSYHSLRIMEFSFQQTTKNKN